MKKSMIMAAAVLAVVLTVGMAAAETSLQSGNVGFNVGFEDSVFRDAATDGVITISGKYLITDTLAIVAGIGTQASSGDYDKDYFSASAGIRMYLRTDDFAPFLEGRVTFATQEDTTPEGFGLERNAFDGAVAFGAEYFLHKQFSLEGAIGIGGGKVEIVDPVNGDTDYTYFGTRSLGVSANFYF